jgi:ElaB/YqjD/DUF883 family membrane-anchored ribosome-binding protein
MGGAVEASSGKTDLPARVGDAVAEKVQSVKDGAQAVAAATQQRAADIADGAKEQVADAGSLLRDNPLGMVGGAFALGLLTGLVLPIPNQERRTIGPVRDSLVDQASALGEAAVEHGKQVVAETAKSAMSTAAASAREHGQELIESQIGVGAESA